MKLPHEDLTLSGSQTFQASKNALVERTYPFYYVLSIPSVLKRDVRKYLEMILVSQLYCIFCCIGIMAYL